MGYGRSGSMGWGQVSRRLSREEMDAVLEHAAQALSNNLPFGALRDRQQLTALASQAIRDSVRALGAPKPNQAELSQMVTRLVAKIGGMGFLDALMPPVSHEFTDIQLNGDGAVWVRRKGELYFELLEDVRPTQEEAWRAIEAILAPAGRALTEATPSVDVKIPRDPKIEFGGARVKAIHPVVAVGEWPTLSIRMYEGRPVPPEKILEWNVMPDFVMEGLLAAVRRRLRVMVIGGTATGKTTLLSALCHGIEPQARIVTIEDPQELWLPHPNITTLEARPAPPGSTVPPYTIEDGVADAMRLSPTHLIVGEVRRGEAALSLFNAMMSDHAGLTTFHAESPENAAFRLAVLMAATEKRVQYAAGKGLFALAIDLVVQVGFNPMTEKRQCMGVWEVEPELKHGEVRFRELWTPGKDEMLPPQRKRGAG